MRFGVKLCNTQDTEIEFGGKYPSPLQPILFSIFGKILNYMILYSLAGFDYRYKKTFIVLKWSLK